MRPWHRWLVVGVGLVVLLAAPAMLLGGLFGDPLRDERAGAALAGWIYAALALDVVLPTPIGAITTLAGHQLGFAAGAATAWAGMTTGNALGLLVGRLLGAMGLVRFLGHPQAARAQLFLRGTGGLVGLAAARPVPVLSEGTVLLAGATGAPFLRSLGVCALANIGMAAVYAGAGALSAELEVLPLAVLAAVVPPLVAAGIATRVRPSR